MELYVLLILLFSRVLFYFVESLLESGSLRRKKSNAMSWTSYLFCLFFMLWRATYSYLNLCDFMEH